MRDRLRQMLEVDQQREPDKRQHRLLERSEFDHLCDEVGGVSDKAAASALKCENSQTIDGNVSLQNFCPNGLLRRNSF